MIAQHLRWAVGSALREGGDDDNARAYLRRVDPLVRGRATRALQSHVEAILVADPGARTGRPMLEAVGNRIGASDAPKRAPFWWPTTVCTLAALVGAGFAIYRAATAPDAFDPTAVEPRVTSKYAYNVGGRPISLGPEGDALLGPAVTEFVIALDRDAREPDDESANRLAKAEQTLLSEASQALLGPDVFTALEHVVESCKVTVTDGERVTGDVDELNAALIEAGLGYHFGDDILRHNAGTSPLLYSHTVEQVRVYDIENSKPERVLWLRRLDSLNLQTNMVGSTHDGAKAAVIRRDLVDGAVFENLLPALGPDVPYTLRSLRPGETATPEQAQLEQRAGMAMRTELYALGIHEASATRLAGLLKTRTELFGSLKRDAFRAGFEIAAPTSYRFDMSPYSKLEPLIGKAVIRELSRIDEELGSTEMGEVYATVRRLYVEAVEFHEIQHRLDGDAADAVPADLTPYAGNAAASGNPTAFSRRLVTEYSAHLAEIAHSQIPVSVLVQLSQHAFDEAGWATTYAETSVGVIATLAREAGIDHGDFVVNRGVDRSELGRVFDALLALPREQLRSLAKSGWERNFKRELTRPVLRPPA